MIEKMGLKMSDQEIEQVIEQRITDALAPVQVRLNDLTGTRDHWEAIIISSRFEGQRLIARQQAVYGALGELMSGPIHAFTMQTLTPGEASARGVQLGVVSEQRVSSDGLVTLE
jgi:stress-induced morphogen